MNKRFLLTAFRNTSAEYLLKEERDFPVLLLPNDKVLDSRILIEEISGNEYDYIISLGQRPNIKDKIHIETTARDADVSITTTFDCAGLAEKLKENGFCVRISNNAGTSYCNRLYLNGLRYLLENRRAEKMVFVHVPFLKNMEDPEDFRRRFLDGIWALKGIRREF